MPIYTVIVRNHFFGNNSGKSELLIGLGRNFTVRRGLRGTLPCKLLATSAERAQNGAKTHFANFLSVKRNFIDISRNFFVTLYKSLVISLSICQQCCCVWYPKRITDADKLERLQNRATKLIPELYKTLQ